MLIAENSCVILLLGTMDLDSNPLPTLGDDLTSQSGIDFESDPRSLRMILENRELSPSVLKFRSSLTPATHTNKMNKVRSV